MKTPTTVPEPLSFHASPPAVSYPLAPNTELECRVAWKVKAIVDRAGAWLALVMLAPLFALVALLIVADSGLPVFYRQTRVGRYGRPFAIHKFRTMTVGAEHQGLGLRVAHDDERITRVGRWLRRSSLDELPQLIDVARGRMSLVGPRPGLPFQAERYSPRQSRRLEVRPGLTGWAQVRGRNSLTWDERIELDLWYIEHWSLLLDARVVLRTPAALLDRTSVYGPDGIT